MQSLQIPPHSPPRYIWCCAGQRRRNMNHVTRLGVAVMVVGFALGGSFARAAAVEAYKQTNLVSDGSASAVTTDADLKNPWGVSLGPSTFFWVANQRTGTATVYDGAGAKQGLTVSIPSAGGAIGSDEAGPTGNIFNNTSDFVVSGSPANFIFVGLDGGVTAWNGGLGSAASLASNQHDRARYSGAALGSSGRNHVP